MVVRELHASSAAVFDVRPRGDVEDEPRSAHLSTQDTGLSVPSSARTAINTPSLADRLRAALALPLDFLLAPGGEVLEWPAALRAYQHDGVRAFLAHDRLLLADDMGLGKTIQAIAALRILIHRGEVTRALIVVPASLRTQWRREFATWAPELRLLTVHGPAEEREWQWRTDAHVTLVSYETLRGDVVGNPASGPRWREWDVVVLDEAQRIKNRNTTTSRACKLLPRQRSWAMTGTPLENSIDDVRSVLEFLEHPPAGSIEAMPPVGSLIERLQRVQLRRRKAEVLTELPPKQVIEVSIPLLPSQRHTYDRAQQDGVIRLRELGAEVTIQNVLELIMRLKQICNFCPATGESAKMVDIEQRLDELTSQGHRALIFSQFTDDTFGTAAVVARLARFNPLHFTGALSTAERARVIDLFKQDRRHAALVLSLRAGGVGLNLQEASYVFHVDRWWNPAIERQAEDRVHRLGQVAPVTVFKYVAEDTIEQRIQEILVSKQRLFDEVVDDVSMDVARALTREELFGLFDLTPPSKGSAEASQRPGVDLEQRCRLLLEGLGWTVTTTPPSRDGGVDLWAVRQDSIGLAQELAIQCKDHARPAGVDVVRELLGALPAESRALPVIVCPSGVTSDAARFAHQRGVAVWDEARLVELEAVSGNP